MRKKYIYAIDIVLAKTYSTMEYITFNEKFITENRITLPECHNLSQLYYLLVQTGFVETPAGLQDGYFQCKITNKGFLMMLTYGSYKNYLKDIKAQRRSNTLMYVFAVVVAVCTILSSITNIIVAFCKQG